MYQIYKKPAKEKVLKNQNVYLEQCRRGQTIGVYQSGNKRIFPRDHEGECNTFQT